jgi:hypothetical protein
LATLHFFRNKLYYYINITNTNYPVSSVIFDVPYNIILLHVSNSGVFYWRISHLYKPKYNPNTTQTTCKLFKLNKQNGTLDVLDSVLFCTLGKLPLSSVNILELWSYSNFKLLRIAANAVGRWLNQRL